MFGTPVHIYFQSKSFGCSFVVCQTLKCRMPALALPTLQCAMECSNVFNSLECVSLLIVYPFHVHVCDPLTQFYGIVWASLTLPTPYCRDTYCRDLNAAGI